MGSWHSAPAFYSGAIIDLRDGRMTLHDLLRSLPPDYRSMERLRLLLGSIEIDSKTMVAFVHLLRSHPALIDQLSLKDCIIPRSRFDTFSSCVRSLTILELDGVNLTETAISAFGRQLLSPNCLERLVISNSSETLKDASFTVLLEGIVGSNVTSFDLSDNAIGDLDMSEICRCLAGSKLKSLSLEGNRMGVWGASAVSKLLALPDSQIQLLNLARNRICVDGASAIAGMLVQNLVLKELDMTGNPLTSAGVHRVSPGANPYHRPGLCPVVSVQIADSLIANPTMELLQLPLGLLQSTDVACRLSQMLQRNRRISAATREQDESFLGVCPSIAA